LKFFTETTALIYRIIGCAIQTFFDFKRAFIAAHPDLKADAALKLEQAK